VSLRRTRASGGYMGKRDVFEEFRVAPVLL
jgi:hypothetical protein